MRYGQQYKLYESCEPITGLEMCQDRPEALYHVVIICLELYCVVNQILMTNIKLTKFLIQLSTKELTTLFLHRRLFEWVGHEKSSKTVSMELKVSHLCSHEWFVNENSIYRVQMNIWMNSLRNIIVLEVVVLVLEAY